MSGHDSELISALRADLRSATFTVSALTGLWGPDAEAALHRNQRVPALRALAALAERLHAVPASATLARLFVLGLPVTPEALAVALPSLGVEGAVALGLVASADGSIVPLADLRPYSFIDQLGVGSWWVRSDLGELSLGHAVSEDHVLGVGGASLTLSGLMIQEPVDSVLDLGTGCGIQAMHAARHANRVVATDISARALAIARFNAELNDIHTIEFRLGSLFDPVAGERFDQILSNPPFVITPRTEGVPSYEYRDGGMVGDALVESVIRGAGEHLTPGGIAQLLGNWEYSQGRDGLDRVTAWLAEDETRYLDAWIIERDTQRITEYAETWIRDGGTTPSTPEFDRLYGAWLDDFEARGVSQVGFGYVTLRRPAADVQPNASATALRRLERLPEALGTNGSGLGTHIAACLAGYDWASSRTDHELAAETVVVAPDVTVERHYWPGDDDPTAMSLRQGSGFGRSVPVGTGLAALVGASDGDLSIGAICGALAQLLDVDAVELQAELVIDVRGLIADGFLIAAVA